mgnify:CR=1 FL=1
MFVKARKMGNSFALTMPASIGETMNLHDGLELKVDYNPYSGILPYQTNPNRVREINWSEFISDDKEDIRDGMTPEDYVRSLRDYDREIIF